MALGWCQLLNVGAMAWSAYMLMESLPCWPINTSITTSIWYNFQLDFVRAFWAVLPGRSCGARAFRCPRGRSEKGEDPGRLVGGVYAANTVGAIFGSVIASLILVLVRLAARAAGADDRLGHVRAAPARAPSELGAGGLEADSASRAVDAHRRARCRGVPDSNGAHDSRNTCCLRACAATWMGQRETSSTSAKVSARRWRCRASAT